MLTKISQAVTEEIRSYHLTLFSPLFNEVGVQRLSIIQQEFPFGVLGFCFCGGYSFVFFFISLNGDEQHEFRNCEYMEMFRCNSFTGNTIMHRVLLSVQMRTDVFSCLRKPAFTS